MTYGSQLPDSVFRQLPLLQCVHSETGQQLPWWGERGPDESSLYPTRTVSLIDRHIRMFLPSVIIPSVPSAPINSLVMSNPAADLRDRLLVLMTLPDGRTMV